jgi:hypothetical protein
MTDEVGEIPETVATPEPPRGDDGRFLPVEPDPVEEPAAQETEADEGEPEETDLHEEKRRGKTAQDRINDLTRARREAERERDFYKGLVSQPTPVSPDGADKPTPDTFDTYDDYVEALTDWKVSQTLIKQSSETANRTEELVRQANWQSKMEAAQSLLPDYEAVVGSSEVPISPHVAQALMDSDRGPELAYHMAQHPELAAELNKLSPVKAAMTLGRLETTLAAPAAKPATKAPAPINPIRSAPARQADFAKASMDDYIEMRRKQGARY